MFSADAFERLVEVGLDPWFVAWPHTHLERRLCERGHDDRLVRLHGRKYFDLGVRRELRRVLQERDRDLIHTFKSSDIFHAALATSGFQRRVGLVHHLQMLPGRSRRDPLHWLVYRRLDRVLTITRQIEDRVRRLWPVPRERVRTLYYGLDSPRPHRDGGGRERARERFGLPRDKLLFGLVGQIGPIKGQAFVLEAFAELADELPDADLVFAGAPVMDDPSYLAQLESRIAELGLQERVHRLGFCDRVPELMPAFDVFVLGSREEPFGLVVIEAMAAGCLTVASCAGGVLEIVEDGVDGFLYAPGDGEALKATLRRVVALPEEERRAARERARRTVDERFSWGRFTAELLDHYREVLAPAGA